MASMPTPIPTAHVDRIDAGIAAETEREFVSNERIREALAQWRDYRDFMPFNGASSPHAVDRNSNLLSEAGCILSALAAAFEDSGALIGAGKASVLDDRSGAIMAGALEGVASLIDLAAFLQD